MPAYDLRKPGNRPPLLDGILSGTDARSRWRSQRGLHGRSVFPACVSARRSTDPPKHIRDRLRRPLAAPRRPNAAAVQRRGDLLKRLRPGGLGLANGID